MKTYWRCETCSVLSSLPREEHQCAVSSHEERPRRVKAKVRTRTRHEEEETEDVSELPDRIRDGLENEINEISRYAKRRFVSKARRMIDSIFGE